MSTHNDPAWKRAGFGTPHAYNKARQEARDWSKNKSQTDSSAYDADLLRDPENFRAYYDAFVSRSTGVSARRQRLRKRRGKNAYLKPSRQMKHWIVDIRRSMTEDEFDAGYTALE